MENVFLLTVALGSEIVIFVFLLHIVYIFCAKCNKKYHTDKDFLWNSQDLELQDALYRSASSSESRQSINSHPFQPISSSPYSFFLCICPASLTLHSCLILLILHVLETFILLPITLQAILWSFHLYFLIFLTYFYLPVIFLLVYVKNTHFRVWYLHIPRMLAVTGAIFFITLVIPFSCGQKFFAFRFTDFHLNRLLTQAGFLGVILGSALEGFAVAQFIFQYFFPFQPTASYIEMLKNQYSTLENNILRLQIPYELSASNANQKRRTFNVRQSLLKEFKNNQASTFLADSRPTYTTPEELQLMLSTRNEIRQELLELTEPRNKFQKTYLSCSWFIHLTQKVTIVLCLYQVIVTGFNAIFCRVASQDHIGFISQFFHPQQNVPQDTLPEFNSFSLFLLSSIFLITLHQIFRRTARIFKMLLRVFNLTQVVLLLCYCLVLHFCVYLLLLSKSFPAEYRDMSFMGQIISDERVVQLLQHIWDITFITSVVASFFYSWIQHSSRISLSKFYQT